MTWTADTGDRPPRVLAGRYEMRGLLGEGGMGQVFEGFDTGSISRPVAIKLLTLRHAGQEDEEADRQRFSREAEAAGRLSHPNVVQVFDAGVDSGQAYIIMELVKGPSLAQLIRQDGAMAPGAALGLMQGVLAGLHFCHEHDVIHCDIKPANIMLAPNGLAKITDFGIAQIERSELTVPNGSGGTPAYMAIEQCNDGETDARTDVYAAGAVLFEMLTGRRLVSGNNQASAIREIMGGIWPAPSSLAPAVPPALDAAVARAIRLQPKDRFQSAQGFSEALAPILQDIASDRTVIPPRREGVPAAPRPPTAPPTAPAPPPAPPSGTAPKPRVLVPLAMGSAVLAAGLCAWFLWPGREVVPPPGPRPPAPAAFVPVPSMPVQPAMPPSPVQSAGTPVQPVAPPPVERPPALPAPAALPAPDTQAIAQVSRPPPVSLPPPVLPVFAPPPPVPVPSAAERVSALVSGTPCTVLDVDMSSPDQVSLTGVGERGTVDKLARDIEALPRQRVVRSVTYVNSVFCPLLDVVAGSLAAGAERLQVVMPGSDTGLARGRRIAPVVVGPGFPAQIAADYVTLGASQRPEAIHLTLAPARTTKDMRVTLGLDRPGNMMLTVDAPFGVDLVVVLASSEALSLGDRTYPPVPGAAFFSTLASAIREGQARGLRLGIGLLPVNTVER